MKGERGKKETKQETEMSAEQRRRAEGSNPQCEARRAYIAVEQSAR